MFEIKIYLAFLFVGFVKFLATITHNESLILVAQLIDHAPFLILLLLAALHFYKGHPQQLIEAIVMFIAASITRSFMDFGFCYTAFLIAYPNSAILFNFLINYEKTKKLHKLWSAIIALLFFTLIQVTFLKILNLTTI